MVRVNYRQASGIENLLGLEPTRADRRELSELSRYGWTREGESIFTSPRSGGRAFSRPRRERWSAGRVAGKAVNEPP